MKLLCAEASMIPIREVPDIRNIRPEDVRPTKASDFIRSLNFVKPSVSQQDILDVYVKWNQQYGSFNFKQEDLDN